MTKFDFDTLRPLCKSIFDHWRKAGNTDTNTPHATGPQVWNNLRSLRFMIRNLMYAGHRKPSMA